MIVDDNRIKITSTRAWKSQGKIIKKNLLSLDRIYEKQNEIYDQKPCIQAHKPEKLKSTTINCFLLYHPTGGKTPVVSP
jgi:hypothetical protein